METNKTKSQSGHSVYTIEYLTELYLKDKYHDFCINADIQINTKNEKLDHSLGLSNKNSFVFITASNPLGEILFPEENLKRYRELQHDLSGHKTHDGEVKADRDNSPALMGIFIFDIDKEQAMQLAIKYGQATFVYGERFQPAIIVFCPLKGHQWRQVLLDRMNRRGGTSPEFSKKVDELFSTPIISVPITFKTIPQNYQQTIQNTKTESRPTLPIVIEPVIPIESEKNEKNKYVKKWGMKGSNNRVWDRLMTFWKGIIPEYVVTIIIEKARTYLTLIIAKS